MASSISPEEARAQETSVKYITGVAVAAVVPGFVFDMAQPDADRAFFKISSGQFDAFDGENRAQDFIVELQPGVTWHRVKPLFGFAGNTDGSFYGWIAAAYDFHLSDHFVVNVNSGPALYIDGRQGKSLGSSGVLRSGFEVGWRLPSRMRLTASLHHMSHGKIFDDFNPGAEIISMNVSWPLN